MIDEEIAAAQDEEMDDGTHAADGALGADLEASFRRLMVLRDKRDNTATAAKKAEESYRQKEAEIWEELENSPIKGAIKVDLGPPYGVVTFRPAETYYGRILDADDALEFFENTAQVEEFTAPKIVKRRVSELVRECIDQGKPMPPGIDFTVKRYVSITRPKTS